MSVEQGLERQQRRRGAAKHSRGGGLPADWRNWLLSATVRAGIATGFLLAPSVRVQLGGAAMAALALFLGMLVIGATAGHWYIARRTARRDLAADAFAVMALAPSTIVAAGIQGAEDRFGGRTVNVLAALAATVLIFAIVASVARLDDRINFGAAAIGALGGALTIAALLGNPARYSTADAWKALSIAWMVAAIATLLFAVLPGILRTILPLAVYAGFALVMVLLPVERPAQDADVGSLPALTLIVIGAIMVLIAPAGSASYADDA